ncbi:MAG: efflux transporter periplasmic adaptor subunit [Gammaproteobacteria bacterium]|nr:MAG: efflux transporter periplasmic adaptor subunit [Gammaproteobacteria bacterium]
MKAAQIAFKAGLPLLVLVVSATIAFHTIANRPEPQRRSQPIAIPEVEVISLERTSYRVIAKTRGTVQPRTESTLIPEVSGRIVEVSSNFRAGEFFEAGDVLLRIDPRDYESEAEISAAELIQARMTLAEEQARGDQAAREWQRLGEPGEPDALVLRKPQMTSARAAVQRAQARLAQTRLAVERTQIVAPYAGRVLEKNADLGQYVSTGTVLAKIYAVDYVEVRLPLSNRQLEYVDVPEFYRSDEQREHRSGPPVRLSARIGRQVHAWEGRLVRAEGTIDTHSRQLFVIAQVDNPYAKGAENRAPLKVGQFVEAAVEGQVLKDVFVIPRDALRAGESVMLLNSDQRLQSRPVQILWSDEENAVIGDGLSEGERLVLTALGPGMEGTEVRLAGTAEKQRNNEPRGDQNPAGRSRPKPEGRPAS